MCEQIAQVDENSTQNLAIEPATLFITRSMP